MRRTKVYDLINEERTRQDDKWGSQRQLHPERWLIILMEEVGEAAEAALDLPLTGIEYRKEMVQVAAVAVAALEAFDG